jgi:APA family basic amino acid/polyamine antiporter
MTDTAKRSEGLSTFAAIAFAVGTMVGAGVFVLSGLVIEVAGSSAILSYLICGIVVSFSALSYAALASIFPEDGGGYLFARRMLGGYPGFLAGWAMFVSTLIAVSFVLLGFGIYLNLLLGINLDPRIGAIAAVLLLTALNLRGLSEAGKLEVGLVVTKVAILILLVIAGLIHIQHTNFMPFMPQGAGGVVKGITMVFFAYMGFQVVSMMGGEIKESSKTVPTATLASIGIVAAIYIGVVIALISVHLPSYGQKSVFDASVILLGTYGGYVVAFAATISTLSSANANIIGASRITLEMASEKQIPGRFTRLVNGQPFNSILLGSAITTVLIVYGNLDFIVNLTNTAMLSTMILVNVSAFMLVKKEMQMPPEKSYFRIPLGTLFPILGVISCVLMLLSLPLTTIIMGIAALLVGSILYVMEDTPKGQMEIVKIRKLLGRPIKSADLLSSLPRLFRKL